MGLVALILLGENNWYNAKGETGNAGVFVMITGFSFLTRGVRLLNVIYGMFQIKDCNL